MEDLRKYLKYYSLGDYLFKDIHKNFQTRGHLTHEEFFAIVIWKSNRAKTKIKNGIEKSGKTIRAITSEVFHAETPEQKLKILTSVFSIGVPIASAILTVCYPDDFTIIDYRALASLKKDFGEEVEGDPASQKYPYAAYFNYLNKCKNLAHKYNLSLREFDQVLWGKDFYEGANGLKDLVKGLDE